jgi:C4-dicarboxylate transporter, DctQ subunit
VHRALALLRKLEGILLGVLMLAMTFTYTANVLVREFAATYASRFAWIDEACLFALAWMVFLGLGLALERGRHISMTSVLGRLAPRLRRGTKFAIDLVGLVFSLYVAHTCYDVTLLVMKSGQVSPTLNVSMSWLYGPMPVGFVLLGFRYLLELIGATDRHAVGLEPALHI